jgi:hypothetical protein
MTDTRTFTFTIEQIKDVYRAGIRRGEEVQSAYDWGSSTNGHEFDECVEAVYDIVNVGKNWEDKDFVSYDSIREWFK